MSKTILVADDNPLVRKLLCKIFEAEEDYDICAEAANGQEAIELAVQHKPHLIILDFSMPVMNGLDAARELKRIMPHVSHHTFHVSRRYARGTIDGCKFTLRSGCVEDRCGEHRKARTVANSCLILVRFDPGPA